MLRLKDLVAPYRLGKVEKKLRKWGKKHVRAYRSADDADVLSDRFYSPSELAEKWGLSVDKIRRLFETESGVLKLGSANPKHKRRYLTLRIPERVAIRIYNRLSA